MIPLPYYKLQYFKFIIITIMFGFTMVTFSTWMLAFLNGDSVTVTINSMGEMYPEMVIWIILIPMLVVGYWFIYDDMMKYRKKWRKWLLGKRYKERIEWL